MVILDLINILLVITIIIYLFFAFFLFMKSRDRYISNSYLIEIGAIIFWTIAMVFYRSSSPENALIWCRLLYIFATFTASGFLFFSIIFPYQEKITGKLALLILGINLVVILMVIHPSLVVRNVYSPVGHEKIIIWGKLYFLYFLYISGFALTASFILFKKYKISKGVTKLQIKNVLIGYFLASSMAMVTNLLMPWMGYFFQNWMGQILTLAMVTFTVYTIMRYRLMDIRTIASKVYVYFLVAFFGYSFFYMSLFVEEFFFGNIHNLNALAFSPVLAFLFAISFLPFFKKIQASSDVIFFKGYNPRSIIKDVALQLSAVIDLDELLNIISAEFKKILASEEIDVLLFDKDGNCSSVYQGNKIKLNSKNSICKHAMRDKSIMVRDEINIQERKFLLGELDKLNAKIVAPLIIRYKVIGMIILGEKMDYSPYTKEDIEFLEIISSQAAVAIENAQLYQEVEDFNKTLKQKVDKQTKEITEKADHLRKLMDMRSEFLDITSHQLRTPVTVIKGVLSMIEEGSVPKRKMKDFIRGALDKSIKLGEIINDILRASEMDTDKFTLNLKEVDLNPILEKIEEDKKTSMQVKKSIKLIFNLPKKPLPNVLSDAKYIEQAIVNLINNSFQYTIEGYINLSTEVKDKSLVIRVADSGIGIPKESIPKLFQKFGRAENAVATYTDGSGLGLFIIKQIVDATPGAKIEIEKTALDKGTTFALTLPVYKKELAK